MEMIGKIPETHMKHDKKVLLLFEQTVIKQCDFQGKITGKR